MERCGRTARGWRCRSSTEVERRGTGIVSTEPETLLRSNLAGSGARVREDCKRGRRENCGEDQSATTVNCFRQPRAMICLQNCRRYHLDERKENEDSPHENERIQPRHVSQTGELVKVAKR